MVWRRRAEKDLVAGVERVWWEVSGEAAFAGEGEERGSRRATGCGWEGEDARGGS